MSCAPAARRSFARPKSRIFTWPSRVETDVVGLQVPVHDAGGVRLGEAVGDLAGQVEARASREGCLGRTSSRSDFPSSSSIAMTARLAPVGVVAGFVDDDDVGVVQGRGGARLLLETADSLGVVGGVFGQDLQGDFPAEPAVSGPIHLAHASTAKRTDDGIGAEALARREHHGPAGLDRTGCHGNPENLSHRRPGAIEPTGSRGGRLPATDSLNFDRLARWRAQPRRRRQSTQSRPAVMR